MDFILDILNDDECDYMPQNAPLPYYGESIIDQVHHADALIKLAPPKPKKVKSRAQPKELSKRAIKQRRRQECLQLIDQINQLIATKSETGGDYNKELIEVRPFNEDTNILNDYVLNRFLNEVIYQETNIFTELTNSTNTLGGFISNVSFLEEELIKEVVPDQDIVLYRCNFGRHRYHDYLEKIIVKKTNRGRKKKEKKKKPRKKQGDGTDFNSQISLYVRSQTSPVVNIKCHQCQLNNNSNEVNNDKSQCNCRVVVSADSLIYKW
jgi:hypothetical protein